MSCQRYANKLIVLAVALALNLPLASWAQFTFITNNGAITITSYTNIGGNVTIPSSINGYPVTAVGDFAFFYKTSLTGVVIPNNVTNIGNYAFLNCSRLTNITIGTSVAEIGNNAFQSCSALTSVTLPSSLTNIGTDAFLACSDLTSIHVNAANPHYASMGGVLFDKAQTILLLYPKGLTGSYVIPNTVTSIVNRAFYGCTGLTSVVIPDSVINLGIESFKYCVALKNVTIPDSITNISNDAFYSCYSLTNATIGSYVLSIGDLAFFYCTNLTSITIPNTTTNIGDQAISDCTGLTNVVIGNSVVKIGSEAFRNCYRLTSVIIPNSVANISDYAFIFCSGLTNATIGNQVTSIGRVAFMYCSNLTSVLIPSTTTNIDTSSFSVCPRLTNITVNAANLSYASAGGVLFNKTMTTLVACPGGLAGNYAIPNGVTSIGANSFLICSGLTSVTIPVSVTNIGGSAFFHCANMHQAYFLGNAPKVSEGDTAFVGAAGTVYRLDNTMGWGSTYGGWPTALWQSQSPPVLGANELGVQNGAFSFSISGSANAVIVVEASTNLQSWTPIATNTLVSGTNAFNDSTGLNYPQRYYRVRLP